MSTAIKHQANKQPTTPKRKSKYKMGVVFANPRTDNSRSTQSNRDPDRPPMLYFYTNTLDRCRFLVNVAWRHDDVLVAIVYDTETRQPVLKYTAEKQWNHAVH
ncbi:MAG TPA: hypothetical protein VJ953_18395 [Saprospiraceae bacterium]|nr:hypothetical protein [Saprospiraceae bacterium]